MTASPARPARYRFIAAASLLALTGCAVGPDYTRPSVATGNGYAEERPVAVQSALDVEADWWALFGHRELNELVAEALRANPTLEAAQHALQAARENRLSQQASFWPQVQASYSPTRTKIAGNLGGNSPGVQGDGSVISTVSNTPKAAGGTAPFNGPVIYDFHTAQVSVSYSPDLFGANRRQLEASTAQVETQRHELQAARITLLANLVSAAIQDGQLRQQWRSAQAAVDAAEAALELVARQRRAGYATAQDEDGQRQTLLALKQGLPVLRQQLESNRDLMRTLIGAPQDRRLPAFELQDFRLPPDLPISLPSRLLEQRPDVRAAEEQLRAAVALAGSARAARLPQFQITGNAGGAAAHLSQAFLAGGRFFDLSANLAVPLFDAGAARHRELAAQATAAQAQAQYRATMLAALQNVADTLHAVEAAGATVEIASQNDEAARRAWAGAKRRLDAGYADRASLLAAELARHQADQQLAGAQAARLSVVVALYLALGGGWWNALPQETAAASHP